jgi:hypothetical protein
MSGGQDQRIVDQNQRATTNQRSQSRSQQRVEVNHPLSVNITEAERGADDQNNTYYATASAGEQRPEGQDETPQKGDTQDAPLHWRSSRCLKRQGGGR